MEMARPKNLPPRPQESSIDVDLGGLAEAHLPPASSPSAPPGFMVLSTENRASIHWPFFPPGPVAHPPPLPRAPSSLRPNIQLTKRPKRMESPSSMCKSAWAPLRREMTDWQPGRRDRRTPEPVMWSAWQWVFTRKEEGRENVSSHPALRPKEADPSQPPTDPESRPQSPSVRYRGPDLHPPPSSRETQGSRPQPSSPGPGAQIPVFLGALSPGPRLSPAQVWSAD